MIPSWTLRGRRPLVGDSVVAAVMGAMVMPPLWQYFARLLKRGSGTPVKRGSNPGSTYIRLWLHPRPTGVPPLRWTPAD
jgi:hypothetical protein